MISNRIALLIIFIMVQLPIPQLVWSQEDRFQKEIPPESVQRLEKGRQLRKSGKFAEAIKIFKALIKDESNYYRAHYNLALAYVFEKNYDEAIKSFTEALEIKQQTKIPEATIYNSIGWMYFLKGNYEKSEEYFQIGLKKENQDLLTAGSKRKFFNNIGLLYMYKRELTLAEMYLEKSAKEYGSARARENLDLLNELKKTQEKTREANKNYYFAVVGSFDTLKEATHSAKKLLMDARYKYKAEIYLAENDYYAVTLGGYLSYDDADARVNHAKSKEKTKDAYIWKSQKWEKNLFKSEDLQASECLAGMYEAIVRHGYHGIMGQKPDSETCKKYVNFLEGGGSILHFCRELMASDKYKENRKDLDANDFARKLYLHILEREPDPGAFEIRVKMIEDGRGAEVAAALLSSDEFKSK